MMRRSVILRWPRTGGCIHGRRTGRGRGCDFLKERRYSPGMCRNIKVLYNFAPPTTPDEIEAAALQYVRKVSGMQKPSQANEAVFAAAIAEVTAATSRLLDGLVTQSEPRDREIEAERRRARAAERFGSAA